MTIIEKVKRGCKITGILLCCAGVIGLSAQGCAGQNGDAAHETVNFNRSEAEEPEETMGEAKETTAETTGETAEETAEETMEETEEAAEETAMETTEAETEMQEEESFVAQLDVADEVTQLIVVETETADSREAVVTMHQLTDGRWEEILRTDGYVGYNGIDKVQQGDQRTPTGLYGVSTPFGLGEDPGSREPYTQVDESYWWVGDGNSRYYNQLVQDTVEDRDWAEEYGEHLIDFGDSYKYCLFIEYNTEAVPGKGACIFLHCNGQNPYTMGCVSIPEEDMIFVLQNVGEDCRILIDTTENINSY